MHKKVGRFRPAIDDVRRAEVGSLGHGQVCGSRTEVITLQPWDSGAGEELGHGEGVERLLPGWATHFSTGSSVFVWPLSAPLLLSLLFVFAGSLGPKSRSSSSASLHKKREIGGQRRKRMSEGRTADGRTDIKTQTGGEWRKKYIHNSRDSLVHSLKDRLCNC